MIDPALLTHARRVICRAMVIAEASAAQTGEVGSGHPSSGPPPGSWTGNVSTLQSCGQRINAALATGSDAEVSKAIEWASAELELIQRGAPGRFAETRDAFAERVVRDYEGLTAPEVVRREHGTTSVTTVRNLRAAAGRDPRHGRRMIAGGSPAVDLQTRWAA